MLEAQLKAARTADRSPSKAELIKALRRAAGFGSREARHAVESFWAQHVSDGSSGQP